MNLVETIPIQIVIFMVSFSLGLLYSHIKKINKNFILLMQIQSIQEKEIGKLSKLSENLAAFGARWGIQTEYSFRNGMKEVLADKGYKVETFREKNEKGVDIEIDLVIYSEAKNPYLIEIKSAIDRHDIIRLDNYSKFYEEKTGMKPARKAVLSPYVNENAYGAAQKYGVEIYTHTGNFK